jgi:hypothetical protein
MEPKREEFRKEDPRNVALLLPGLSSARRTSEVRNLFSRIVAMYLHCKNIFITEYLTCKIWLLNEAATRKGRTKQGLQ